jgi:hypothetical protein
VVRHHSNGKLNKRDEVACRMIMRALLPHVPLAAGCSIDLYNLSEGTDIFKPKQQYDLAIFSNLRALPTHLTKMYNLLSSESMLESILEAPREPQDIHTYKKDIMRGVADALRPSDILSGQRFSGIPREHTYYVTVSEQAMQNRAYEALAKELQCRFIATWGFVQFINGSYFAEPSTYDLSQSPSQRLLKSDSFTLSQQPNCELDLIEPYVREVMQSMPDRPLIDFAVRNDVLETIVTNEKHVAKDAPLFAHGVGLIDKMELLATIQAARGRTAVGNSRKAELKTLSELKEIAARPLNWCEKAERTIRQAIS